MFSTGGQVSNRTPYDSKLIQKARERNRFRKLKAVQSRLSRVEKWEKFQEFARVHSSLKETVEEHEPDSKLPVVNDTTLMTDTATHVNIVSMVAKCIKQYDNKNFAASSKLFDSWGKAVIDVYKLEENLRLSWNHNPLDTRKLIFYMGNMKHQRWVFRFAMVWMYRQHREEFMANVETIQSLMSLQEVLEILTFCLNPVDSPLFGIKTAYAKHLLSKKSHAGDNLRSGYYDASIPVRDPRQYKDEKWKMAQRRAFAESKGVPLNDIYALHYDAEQQCLMTLIHDVNFLYGIVRQFQHKSTQGPLYDVLHVDPMPFFEKFLDSDGSYVPDGYLDEAATNSCTKETTEDVVDGSDEESESDDSDGGYYYGYFSIPPNFLRKDRAVISTSNRCAFLQIIKERVQAALLHTFNNVSQNLINNEVDNSWVRPDYMKPNSYDRIEYFKELEMIEHFHTPHVPQTEQDYWYEHFSEPERQFDTTDKVDDMIEEQDEYNRQWFAFYGGEFMFMTEEDGQEFDIGTHKTLVDQVDWYENACINFFWPEQEQEAWTVEADEKQYEQEIANFYRSAPWTQFDVRNLRDVENVTKKANRDHHLLHRKGFKTDELKKEYDEFLKKIQAQRSVKTQEDRRTEQAKHEKFNFSDFRKNKFFIKVVQMFVDGLLFELHQTKCIEAGSTGVELHGMFAKWAPSPNHHHDKATGIASAISEMLAVKLSWDANARNATSIYNYAHEVLSPIRRAAKIAESFIGHDTPEWSKIDFEKLSEWAMAYGWETILKKNDPVRYMEYLDDRTKKLPKVKKIRPSAVMQSHIDAMAYLELDIDADSIHKWTKNRMNGSKTVQDPFKFLSLYKSLDYHNWVRRGKDDDTKNACITEAEWKMKIGGRQWESMLLEAVNSFEKIKKSQNSHRECVVTILDTVGNNFDVEAKSLAVLLATCTRVAGSPWHSDNGSDIVCSYGTDATYQTVSTAHNPVKGGEALFTIDARKMLEDARARASFETPRKASIYQAMDLVTQRAIEHNITAQEFATWTLVFISDREFEEPEALKSQWHLDLELPYMKMRKRIDASGLGGVAGYPKFIFYREDSDVQERHSSGIPVESDTVPGVVLMSGDANSCVGDILEACFSKDVTSTQSALQRALGRTRFDQVNSRVGM